MWESWIALLAGLVLGSFLNVCIHRMPKDLSVVRPRSHCPACGTQIAWYDNLPLVSYVALRGRCRHCRARIPFRYFLVELLTGVLFFLTVAVKGLDPAAVKLCVFFALSIGLLFADLEERILPDQFTLGGAALGLAFAAWVPMPFGMGWALLPSGSGPRLVSVGESVLGAVVAAGMLWLVGAMYLRIRKREGLGFGDVKMMLMVGAFLGLQVALLTLILGSVLGSVVGVIYIRATRKDAATYQLPFGTFLAAAAMLVAVAGGGLWRWYWSLGE